MKSLRSVIFPTRVQVIIAATVVFFFLGLLPFAGALEVHHIFAEADHDGHEHSDFDLCNGCRRMAVGLLILIMLA